MKEIKVKEKNKKHSKPKPKQKQKKRRLRKQPWVSVTITLFSLTSLLVWLCAFLLLQLLFVVLCCFVFLFVVSLLLLKEIVITDFWIEINMQLWNFFILFDYKSTHKRMFYFHSFCCTLCFLYSTFWSLVLVLE